jgi:hypothetical protein
LKTQVGNGSPPGRRGRPSKFGRPSSVVALTLPDEVIRGLGKIHADLAWAVVTLFEKAPTRKPPIKDERPDVELVTIGERRSLISVSREVVKSLPGINISPLSGNRAFLALDPERGMPDLELAVVDRLESASDDLNERKALLKFRHQLRAWRHDRTLRFRTRVIIVVERTDDSPKSTATARHRQRPSKATGRKAPENGQEAAQPTIAPPPRAPSRRGAE